VVGAERVVGVAQRGVVALELLGLPPRAAVLEPDGNLARLQAEVQRQPRLPLRLQLVLRLEAPLQRAHLIRAQPPLLLPAPASAAAAQHHVLVGLLHPDATKAVIFPNKPHISETVRRRRNRTQHRIAGKKRSAEPTAVNNRKEAGAAATAAGDGAARSLHAESLDFTRNSQIFQEKKTVLIQSQGEGRITEGFRSGEGQPGKG
jgi:hypothetical protein